MDKELACWWTLRSSSKHRLCRMDKVNQALRFKFPWLKLGFSGFAVWRGMSLCFRFQGNLWKTSLILFVLGMRFSRISLQSEWNNVMNSYVMEKPQLRKIYQVKSFCKLVKKQVKCMAWFTRGMWGVERDLLRCLRYIFSVVMGSAKELCVISRTWFQWACMTSQPKGG